jgi:hypothetical protein
MIPYHEALRLRGDPYGLDCGLKLRPRAFVTRLQVSHGGIRIGVINVKHFAIMQAFSILIPHTEHV